MLKVSTHVDVRSIEAQIEAQVDGKQEMFADDLRPLIQRAAGRVIKGNLTGQGPYRPRPVGTFGSPRARYHRGWVTGKYGSSRARRAGARDTDATDRSKALREQLQKRVLLETAAKAGGSVVLDRVAKAAQANLRVAQKLGPESVGNSMRLRQQGEQPQDLLSQYLSHSPRGKRLVRKAGFTATKLSAGKMRYGFQTGLLADAWYALDAVPGSGLSFTLTPAAKTTPGTPEPEILTASLARQAGTWAGLMDTDQLLDALRDQGVIARG